MEEALARRLVDGLKAAGIDFVTYLPETRLSQIVPLLRDDPGVELVATASEQEAVTIAVGATLGGKQAAVYMESTGVLVSTYSLAVTGKQLGVPLLLIVAHLGGERDQRNHFLYATIGRSAPGVLDGLGIGYESVTGGEGVGRQIADGLRVAKARREPYALLFSGEFSE